MEHYDERFGGILPGARNLHLEAALQLQLFEMPWFIHEMRVADRAVAIKARRQLLVAPPCRMVYEGRGWSFVPLEIGCTALTVRRKTTPI